jgi:thiamine kinase-like enzyme
MSDAPYDVEKDPYPLMSKWRQSERHNMIAALRDMIDEASKMAKSKRAPASERIRWTRLAGQLIWYKDAILRSMSLESMENEMFVIKKQVFEKKPEQKPPPGYNVPNLR